MTKYILSIFIILTFLSGCSTISKAPVILDKKDQAVFIDPQLLHGCKDLIVPSSPITFDSVLANTRANVLIHIDCKNRMNSAIVVLKKFSNQP